MRSRPRTFALLSPLMVVPLATTGCGIPGLPGIPSIPGLGSLPGLPSTSGGQSTEGTPLWPDVPAVPGAAPIKAELPLPVKLVIKGYLSTVGSHLEDGQQAKDFDARMYQVAPGTDVSGFYTQARMATTGWTSPGDCQPIVPVCTFTKPAAGGFTDGLLILTGDPASAALPSQERSSDPNQPAGIIYARFSFKDDNPSARDTTGNGLTGGDTTGGDIPGGSGSTGGDTTDSGFTGDTAGTGTTN